jgi:DNA polymerase-1
MYGRKVFLPNINHSNFQVRSGAERTAINAPIQGTAADILKLAMIKIKNWLDKEKISDVYMIMQVHDELVFEIKECDLKSIGPKICDLMIHAERLNVPLIVNTFNGYNWSEG